jgi:hypothetical protein
LDEALFGKNADPETGARWSIRERSSLPILPQLPSSLEEIVLANPNSSGKHRVALNDAQVWSYDTPQGGTSNKALFVDGTVRAMPLPSISGVAHSEAFIHPALLGHMWPKRVLIISETPLSLIQRVWQYESVLHTTVVGTNPSALELTKQYMNSMTKCPDDDGNETDCLSLSDDDLYFTDTQDVKQWLEDMADGMIPNPDHDTLYTDDPYELRCAVHPQFDAVFVDIPTGKDDSPWLDIDFHISLKRLLNPESVVVVNSGSAPSMDWPYDTAGAEYPGRDNFVRQAGRNVKNGGIGYYVVSVYDEVSERQASFCRIYPFLA